MDNIHDKYFKESLEIKDNAIAFLNVTLPAKVSSLLDMKTLSSVKESFITTDLKGLFADVVFDCKLATGEDVYCSILIEHKSYNDPYVAFQIGSYLFAAYRTQIKAKQPLKVIIPLLFYHHDKEWKFRTIDSFFEYFPREMHRFVPRFDTVFFDVKRMSDEEIMNVQNLAIATFLLSQKHIHDLDGLVEKILKIIESLQNYEERNSIASTLVYIKLQVAKIESKQKYKNNNSLNKKFMAVVEELFTDIKRRISAENLEKGIDIGVEKGIDIGVKKGKAEGKAEGINIGIEQKVIEVVINGYEKGLDISMLANITQLTDERVIEILKKNGLMQPTK